MAIYNTEGLPVRLLVQPDANLAALSAQLSPGQTLRGRVTDVMPEGKAVVNFRGISVVAELKGVILERGEVISVAVQNLEGTPTFKLLPSGPVATNSAGVAGEPVANAAVLGKLGLPADPFHSMLVQLMEEYGISIDRQTAMAVREVAISDAVGGSLARGTQAIETAVFMYLNSLPAHGDIARAAHEYLFGESRLPDVLARFEAMAASLGVSGKPVGSGEPGMPVAQAMSPAIREAIEAALAVARGVRVDPGIERVPDQLRTVVEGMGLGHESRLARAVDGSGTAMDGAVDAGGGKETLKAAMLLLAGRLGGRGGESRDAFAGLRGVVDDVIRLVQAQQVGSMAQRNATVVYVQIPLVIGSELKGGDMEVAWRREKSGRRRDPGKAAHMTLTLETRSLGVVSVQMRVLGQGLSLAFRVHNAEAQAFINRELPELVERLTGRKFRLNACTCEAGSEEGEEMVPARPVRPTSSLDLKA